MKRIVFVTTNDHAPTGGSEYLWADTATYMHKIGFSVAVSVKEWLPTPKHVSLVESSGCLTQKRSPRKNFFGKNFASKFFSTLRRNEIEISLDWIENFRPDLVVLSMGNNTQGIYWIEEFRKRGINFALLIHLAAEHNWLPDAQAESLSLGYRAAQKCFFVSNRNRLLTEKMLGTSLYNADIVQNPFKVPHDIPFDWPRECCIYKLCCVANLSTFHKGQDILFEVLRQDKWRKRPVEVSLVGTGPHFNLLKRLKNIWNLEHVHFMGFQEDIPRVWKDHHALVLCSRMEGLPISLVEAMLCGRVPIVTDVGGNSEIVEDGVNGFIAKAPTVEMFDETLEQAWMRRDQWRDIGLKAYRHIRDIVPSNPVAEFALKLQNLC